MEAIKKYLNHMIAFDFSKEMDPNRAEWKKQIEVADPRVQNEGFVFVVVVPFVSVSQMKN